MILQYNVRITDSYVGGDRVAELSIREATRVGDSTWRFDAQIMVDRGSAVGVYQAHAYIEGAEGLNPLGILQAILNSLEPKQMILEGVVVDSSNGPANPGPPVLER